MDIQTGFAIALKNVRKAKKLSQEDFSDVSSRTYLSTLERGLKSPTLDKISDLSSVLEVHPLTLLTSTFANVDGKSIDELFDLVRFQLSNLNQ